MLTIHHTSCCRSRFVALSVWLWLSSAGAVDFSVSLAPSLPASELPLIEELNEVWDESQERARSAQQTRPSGEPVQRSQAVIKEMEAIRKLLRVRSFNQALIRTRSLLKFFPNDPAVHNLLGGVYLAKSDSDNAHQAFEQALALYPESIAARMNLAALLTAEEPGQAQKYYREVLTLAPGHSAAALQLTDLLGPGQPALQVMLDVLAVDPQNRQMKLKMIQHLLALKQWRQAVSAAEELRAQSDDVGTLRALGALLVQGGRSSLGLGILHQLADSRPESPEVWYWLALAYGKLRDAQQTETMLRRSLEAKQNYLPALIASVRLAQQRQRWAEALDWAFAIQERYPNLPEGFMLQGDVYASQNDYRQAAAAYKTAFGKKPDSVVARKMARASRLAGDDKSAAAMLNRQLRLERKDWRARLELAMLLQDRGEDEKAIGEYQKVLEQMPNNAVAMNNLAWLYLKVDDARALALAENAYRLLPDHHDSMDTYGWALLKYGQPEQAAELLEKAATTAGESALVGGIRYRLALAYQKLGEKEKAVRLLSDTLSSELAFDERREAQQLLIQLRLQQ